MNVNARDVVFGSFERKLRGSTLLYIPTTLFLKKFSHSGVKYQKTCIAQGNDIILYYCGYIAIEPSATF